MLPGSERMDRFSRALYNSLKKDTGTNNDEYQGSRYIETFNIKQLKVIKEYCRENALLTLDKHYTCKCFTKFICMSEINAANDLHNFWKARYFEARRDENRIQTIKSLVKFPFPIIVTECNIGKTIGIKCRKVSDLYNGKLDGYAERFIGDNNNVMVRTRDDKLIVMELVSPIS